MAEEHVTAMVCARKLGESPPISGAIVSSCRLCGCDVWLSVSGQRLLSEKPGTVLQCVECSVENLAKGNSPRSIGVVPGAFEEIADHIRKN